MILGYLRRKAARRFSRQLAMLLESGIRIDSALKLIEYRQTNRRWRHAVQRMRQMMRGGMSLEQCIRHTSALYSRGYVEAIGWAESTGDPKCLITVLRFLADDLAPTDRVILSDSAGKETMEIFSRAMRD